MGRESRVITAAVFHMKYKSNIQKLCFQRGIGTVRTENTQDILCGRKIRIRTVDIQAVAVVIMAVCLITINGKQRKQTDQLQTLTQHIRKRSIVCAVVIRIQCQYASCQCVHHIAAGCLHNNIAYKAGRKITVFGQEIRKIRKLLHIRQLIKEQKISDLFKAETIFVIEALHKVAYIVTAVK